MFTFPNNEKMCIKMSCCSPFRLTKSKACPKGVGKGHIQIPGCSISSEFIEG